MNKNKTGIFQNFKGGDLRVGGAEPVVYCIFKKIYEKIKNNLVNKYIIKEEKFSIINDIYQFIKNFNPKYNTKLDFNIILQSDEEDLKIVDKVGNYLIEFFSIIMLKIINL